MRLRHLFILFVTVAAMAVAQQQRTEFRADMSGIGKGKVVYKTKTQNTGVQAEIQAEGENLPANSTFKLDIAGGQIVRLVTTDAFGTYRYAQKMLGFGLPTIREGDLAILTDSAGNVVQMGAFRLKA